MENNQDNNLIQLKIEVNDKQEQTISGRALHEFLGVNTRYNDWFKRMLDYDFTEGKDFYSILSKTSDNGRPSTDHQLTINMAKRMVKYITENQPKIDFANAVTASKDCIYIRELAKILTQNGLPVGEKKLYKYLRENNYLIKDRRADDYNQPTQRAAEMKIFKVQKTVYETALGKITNSTTLVTPKGQQFFINKFKKYFNN